MLDHKNLPSKVDQMRAEVLKEDKAGKAIPKNRNPSPERSPPHGPGEGVGSSSSQADPSAAAKEETSNPIAATGNPVLPCKSAKKKG